MMSRALSAVRATHERMIRNNNSSQRGTNRKPARRRGLTILEPLENRSLLAVTLTYDACDGSLHLDTTANEILQTFSVSDGAASLNVANLEPLEGSYAAGVYSISNPTLVQWIHTGDALGASGHLDIGELLPANLAAADLKLNIAYVDAAGHTAIGDMRYLPCEGASIHGMKWHDLNGDGQKQPNEPGLDGWVIQVINSAGELVREQKTHSRDLNNDGQIDPATESGLYWFKRLPDGRYTVREVVEAPWRPTAPPNGSHTIVVDSHQTVENLNFGNARPGSIHGVKYIDWNGDGKRQPNEPGLPGWQIGLLGEDGMGQRVQINVETMSDDPTTPENEQGMFWIENVKPGQYELREGQRPGWTQTAPADGVFAIRLTSGAELTGFEFGNRPEQPIPGAIHGYKWEDLNANGQRDPGEPGLNGVLIELHGPTGQVIREQETHSRDLNNDGVIDPIRETGLFWFEQVLPGNYVVTEKLPPGWNQSYPLPPSHQVDLGPGQVVDDITFGNWRPGSVHGRKFLDRDGDGKQDPNEPGLAGWTIVLVGVDGMGNTIRRTATSMEDNPQTTVDETGMFWFNDVKPGRYGLREELRQGWEQTAPEFGGYRFDLASGQHILDRDFGNRPTEIPPGSIHGIKFEDRNANGVRDPGEPGIPGVVIVATNNIAGAIIEYKAETMEDDPATDFDESGMYWIESVRPGVYTVSERIPEGWFPSLPMDGMYKEVQVGPGQGVDGVDFGNWRPASVHGLKFLDRDGDGKQDPNEPGIPGWTIVLVGVDGMGNDVHIEVKTMTDDPATAVDESGMYWIDGVKPGRYKLEEVQRPGWEQTAPSTGSYSFPLASGEHLLGRDFGNRRIPRGGIHGIKYHDINGNGKRDANEPGLAGWTIVITSAAVTGGGGVNKEVVTMEDNPATDFDETGMFWCNDLPPGVYTVREVLQPGWRQSEPANGSYVVTVGPNQTVDGVAFGNYKPGSIHGHKWFDINGNGQREAGEPGMAWITVFDDVNNNELLDPGEPSTMTMHDDPATTANEEGGYWLEGLRPGRHTIREVIGRPSDQTFPGNGAGHELLLRSGERIEGINFGNKTLPADFDGSGKVDLLDFKVLRENFNQGPVPRKTWQQGDATGDGRVNLSDFAVLRAHFNRMAPTGPLDPPAPSLNAAAFAFAADAALADMNGDKKGLLG